MIVKKQDMLLRKLDFDLKGKTLKNTNCVFYIVTLLFIGHKLFTFTINAIQIKPLFLTKF